MNENKNVNKNDRDAIYNLDGKPSLAIAIPLGLQHVLAMFIGNITPLLIISGVLKLSGGDATLLVQCSMFVAGATTFLQLYPLKIGEKRRIGAGLPIVMGTSFATVAAALTIGFRNGGGSHGFAAVLGAVLIASILQYVIGFFYPVIKNFFPPVVIGVIILAIGLKLLPVAADYFCGGAGLIADLSKKDLVAQYGDWQNLTVAFSVFFLTILLQKFGQGVLKSAAVLISIVVGYIMAISLGLFDATQIANAAWFSVPTPLHFGMSFSVKDSLTFLTVALVISLETIGNTSGITIAAFNREATSRETSGAVLGDAVGTTFAALFNVMPSTAFGQNAGIVAVTKVVNRFCIATGATLLLLCSFIPKLAGIFSAMPSSVLGGAVISVFAIIAINGMKLIAKSGFNDNNLNVVAIALGIGYALSNDAMLVKNLHGVMGFVFSDSTTCVAIVAILANLFFNWKVIFSKEAAIPEPVETRIATWNN